MNSIIVFFQKSTELLFGPVDDLLHLFVLFVAIDYITGVMVAFHQRKLSSKIGFLGIGKKFIAFVVIAIAHAADQYLTRTDELIQQTTTLFFMSNECISILENAGKLGIKLPGKLKALLKVFSSQNEA